MSKEKKTKSNKSRGLLVQADDFEVGNYYLIHSHKQTHRPLPGMGLAFKVVALNLPYIAAEFVTQPQSGTATLDVRYVNLMKANEDFVKAQMPRQQTPQIPEIFQGLFSKMAMGNEGANDNNESREE